ncbi:MAG: HU family DNA-binding protein [Bacteroidales bacterium]|nr:HU family DNA-binding protein [Bacteroidales bacterium]
MTDTKLQLTDLAHGLSRRASLPLRYSEDFVKSFFQIVEEGLLHDNMVKVKGFGTFKLVDVNARESINVNSGQRFEIAGHTKVTFTPDPVLRDAVNKPFVEFQTVILNENVDTALMEDLEGDHLSDKVQAEPAVNVAEERLAQMAESVVEPQTETSDESVKEEQTAIVGELQSKQVEEVVEASQPVVAGSNEDNESDGRSETLLVAGETSAAEVEETVEEVAEEVEETAAESEVAEEAAEEVEEEPSDEVFSDEELYSSSTEEADNNHSPSFTTNSYTEQLMDHHSHTSLWILLTAVLFTILGYCLGYYWHPIDLPELSPLTSQSEEDTTPEEPTEVEGDVMDSTVVTSSQDSTHVATSVAQPASAVDYPQLDGGEYLIVGVMQADTMTAGKTLLNMAIKYYGDKECYKYICVMNGIDNPDIVPLNMPLRIPKLQKK